MRSALIGYTGFVGGNLAAQYEFTDLYNSSTIEEMKGQTYDVVVCAGARAEKWKINQDPDTDWQNLEKLMQILASAQISEFVLISTVDVYPKPLNVDETTIINPDENSAYGKHRFALETFCKEQFPKLTIIRLPGLFGTGLKKNIIFDYLHKNNLDKVHADGVFQFYFLDHLWKDIEVARQHNLGLLNIATEPVSVAEVIKAGFGEEFTNRPADQSPARYDFHTVHAEAFSKQNPYLYSKDEVLADIHMFVQREQA